MHIKLSGLLIDKYEQESTDRATGALKRSLKVVVYQKESHQAITVTVEPESYNKFEEMKNVTINCHLGTFVSNGKAIQYFKEVA